MNRRAVILLVALACTSATPSARAHDDRFGWPLVPRPHVVTEFDLPDERWLPGHRGVDLSSDAGQTVLAAGDGVVVYAGTVANKPVVSIDHVGGLRTTYEPVDAAVTAGDRVSRGEPIGIVVAGHPGCPSDACLHWGVRRDREYLDPTTLVGVGRVRLKSVVTYDRWWFE